MPPMPIPTRLPALWLVVALIGGAPAGATNYYVAPGGSDAADGRSPAGAWASVERACEAAGPGDRVRLAPGEYPLARSAVLRSGVTLVGADRKWDPDDRDAPRFSTLVPGTEWVKADPPGDNAPDQYLLRVEKGAADVTVRLVRFRGSAAEDGPAVVTGAVHADRAANLTLDRLTVDRFRLCGFRLLHCSAMTVAGCRLTDAALEKDGRRWGGMIWTRWPKDSVLENCRIVGARSGGYGIKGHGSDGFRITRCVIEGPYFAVEHPHENEFGLEIDHCRLGGCISVPKGGPQADPATRGHERSVYIHHNLLTDSYTVEGPRNHLEFAYNYVRVDRPNGRCYTHHGGTNPGPVEIHHNVFENVDRACVWMNDGYFAGLRFFNNTVFAADAGDRGGFLFSAGRADRLDDWQLKNNLLVAAWSRPRGLRPDRDGVPAKMTFARNLFVNLSDAPADNFTAADAPGGAYSLLTRAGEKPAPFYEPTSATAFVVDRGEDVGLPFAGAAPDLGAFEFGSDDDPWADWSVPNP